jgi:hypothetical protein
MIFNKNLKIQINFIVKLMCFIILFINAAKQIFEVFMKDLVYTGLFT